DDTKMLVKQFSDDTPLIVTTIQKLNSAIIKKQYSHKMAQLQDKKIIFIFDECHRSQFGETHKRIKEFFNNTQMFGFTGTPIFAENAIKNELGKRTTKELFDECLHKYVITDAIRDENVLKFAVEYVGRYKYKDSQNNLDIEVEDIDTKELLESPDRLEKITDYIIANHGRKTHNREFTAMFCVSSVETLIQYYKLFKERENEGKHYLKIATIFSYVANEDDKDANGYLFEEPLMLAADSGMTYSSKNKHTRDVLEDFIGDYNKLFDTKYTTKDSDSFYNYYRDIGKRVKEKQIDLLLVVNMFLTGFDSKTLNTLYVDKNLKYHGLIQAYSRTNRILNELKSQGNIVVFRNLKSATDDALALFSNKDAKDVIFMEPYENYVEKFKEAFKSLTELVPSVDSVNDLETEEDELEFVKRFRELLRIKNVLVSFADFKFDDLTMDEQTFEDYKSKYLDIYDKVKSNHQKEKVSILDDVDFELELIHRDDINVSYILQLLTKLKNAKKKDQENQRNTIIDLLGGDAKLRSKKELIEKFILENLPNIQDSDTIKDEFSAYWEKEQQEAYVKLCQEEQLDPDKITDIIGDYLFTERQPMSEDIVKALKTKPKILERKTIVERVTAKLMAFIETFIEGVEE
ncbi:MAG: type I restriction endonuclease subunit R, partial [Bacteroidetes bacterium]|nr:type I restriction endonuclease subunit R [Bacteroidota bacterium]